MSTEFNFTQEITLPSRGLLNPEIPEGKVVQRCMMVADQKILSGSTQSAGSALTNLLKATTTTPSDLDVDNLTLADTMYLLFKLRVLSYGKNYTFMTRCPVCSKKIEVNIDLSELPVQTLEDDFTEDLVVELPHRGDTVYTKVITNGDLEYIAKESKRRKKRNPNDDSEYILRIVHSIQKIVLKKDKSTLTNPIDIENYINSLTDLDAQTIIATRDSVAFGIAPSIEYVCPECKSDIDVSLQFSGDFFRPSIIKKS